MNPLNAAQIEKTAMELWQAFLAGFFDGQFHVVGEQNIQFPLIPQTHLLFQEAHVPHPMDGLSIHVVSIPQGDGQIRWNGGRQAYHRVTWEFRVRAKVKAPRVDGMNSAALARLGSDTLYALLTDPDSMLPLYQNGINRVFTSVPRPMSGDDWATRILNVRMLLHYNLAIAIESSP
jgi:hypothetical protein